MDNISQGSEDDEIDVASMDEDDFTLGASTSVDVLDNKYTTEPSSNDESDCCEGGFLGIIELPVDRSLRSTMTSN